MGDALRYWRLFEKYLDSMRYERDKNGRIPEEMTPPIGAWTAYFMCLAL